MRVVLAAIHRAEGRAPEGVLTHAARSCGRTSGRRPRTGVLGPYAIDAAGDTSLRRWGAYRVSDGALRFVEPLSGGRGDASAER